MLRADAIGGGAQHEVAVVGDQTARNLGLHAAAVLDERPGIQAVLAAELDAVVAGEIGRPLGRSVRRQIVGRGHGQEPARLGHPHGDHVLRDNRLVAHAGVHARVEVGVVADHQFDLDRWVGGQEPRDHRRYDQRQGQGRHRHLEGPGGFGAEGVEVLEGGVEFDEGGRGALQQSCARFGQGHAAGGAVE